MNVLLIVAAVVLIEVLGRRFDSAFVQGFLDG